MKNNFAFFSQQRKFESDQEFWVAQTQNSSVAGDATCQAVRISGATTRNSCTESLPVLCTQSAPPSTRYTADKSEKFQVTQTVGSQKITGFRDFYSFRFLGIRYAPQPTRFTYSTLYEGPGNQSALDFGSKCTQSGEGGTEDCLFLNIFTPTLPTVPAAQDQLKPVMFWIHGGGFVGDSTQNIMHDGTHLASRGDVVVVSIEYRLSTLGFLALDNNRTTGNWALSDMVNGLMWVNKYISAFGGDPNQVTILGESAGGHAMRTMLGSPKAKGLFHKTIMISGGGNNAGTRPDSLWKPSKVAGAQTGAKILELTGCANKTDSLACLRAYNASKLVALPTVAKSVHIHLT